MRRVYWKVLLLLTVISINLNLLGFAYIKRLNDEKAAISMQQQQKASILDTGKLADQDKVMLLKSILTKDELSYVAQRLWEYKLMVNGNEFNENTLYIDQSSNIVLMIGEVDKSNGEVPGEILDLGRLCSGKAGDELTNYISVTSIVPCHIRKEERGNNVKYYYEFSKVPSGTIITIELGEILKDQLFDNTSISGNRLQVIVK